MWGYESCSDITKLRNEFAVMEAVGSINAFIFPLRWPGIFALITLAINYIIPNPHYTVKALSL
jgi:hypothetical protein